MELCAMAENAFNKFVKCNTLDIVTGQPISVLESVIPFYKTQKHSEVKYIVVASER